MIYYYPSHLLFTSLSHTLMTAGTSTKSSLKHAEAHGHQDEAEEASDPTPEVPWAHRSSNAWAHRLAVMEHGRVFLMWPFKKVWYCHNCHEIFLKFNCQVLTVTYSNWNLESLISYWNMKRKTGELNWNWSPFLRSLGSFFTQLWASQLWSFPMGLPVKHTEILHLSKLSPSRHFQGGRFPGNQFRSGLVPSVADCLFPKKNGGQICNLDFWHKITESSSVPILSPPPQTKEIYITHLLHASSGNVVWDATTGTTTSSCGSMSSTDQIYICSGIPIGRIVQGIHGIEKTIDSEELQEIASTEPKEVYTSSSSTRTLSNMPCHICEDAICDAPFVCQKLVFSAQLFGTWRPEGCCTTWEVHRWKAMGDFRRHRKIATIG